jgi:hypothetical protein
MRTLGDAFLELRLVLVRTNLESCPGIASKHHARDHIVVAFATGPVLEGLCKKRFGVLNRKAVVVSALEHHRLGFAALLVDPAKD